MCAWRPVMPASPCDPLRRHYNIHRIFPAKPTAELRHAQVDSPRHQAERVAANASAWKFPTATSALAWSALTATQDWSPWPTPQIQTGTIASIAPRATSPAQSATSLGNGWCSHLPSQLVPSRTAPTVLPRSKPAFRRLCAGCGRLSETIPGHLAGVLNGHGKVWRSSSSWCSWLIIRDLSDQTAGLRSDTATSTSSSTGTTSVAGVPTSDHRVLLHDPARCSLWPPRSWRFQCDSFDRPVLPAGAQPRG